MVSYHGNSKLAESYLFSGIGGGGGGKKARDGV